MWQQGNSIPNILNWKVILLSYSISQPLFSPLSIPHISPFNHPFPPVLFPFHYLFRKEQAFKRWPPNMTKQDKIKYETRSKSLILHRIKFKMVERLWCKTWNFKTAKRNYSSQSSVRESYDLYVRQVYMQINHSYD